MWFEGLGGKNSKISLELGIVYNNSAKGLAATFSSKLMIKQFSTTSVIVKKLAGQEISF
jgi:hypothetical protein